MSRLPLEQIEDRVRAIVAASALGNVLMNVSVEPVVGPFDDEYLRIVLELDAPDTIDRKQAIGLTRDIEDAFADIEERFPSVRFAEAA